MLNEDVLFEDNFNEEIARKVMVVEDDPITEARLNRIINKFGPNVEVEWASNADEAFWKLNDLYETNGETFDLIVSDIFLDGSATGIDLWEKLQNFYPDTPVVLTSGMSTERFYETIGDNRVVPPFLPKPFTQMEFKELLEYYLDRDGGSSQWIA